jgi:hypothetical protein
VKRRAEIETRLLELERDIEKQRTGIWLAEHERETLRNELRWFLYAADKAPSPRELAGQQQVLH